MPDDNNKNVLKKLPYFPSSSNSWYSSVNLVQIVNAILTVVPRGVRTETRIRCTHSTVSTTLGRQRRPVSVLDPARQTEGFMHSWSASAGALVGWFFLRQMRFLRECFNVDKGGASGVCRSLFRLFGLFFLHTRRFVTARRRSILCASRCLRCVSVRRRQGRLSLRASDAALPHLPPAVRSGPPLCLHPHPGHQQTKYNSH